MPIQQKQTQQEQTYKGKLPFDEIVVFPSQEQQRELAAKRAEKATNPHFDFSKAQDINENDRKWYNDRGNGWFWFMQKPLNCINTATHWITNDSTLARNRSLLETPEKFGYTPITKKEAKRGDLIQYANERGVPEHAGVILENNHYVTAVRSSMGGSNINPIREYNSEGINTEDRYDPDIKNANYYRYTYPHSGVYFKVNGKLTQAKKLGGIIGLSNIIFGL